MVFLPIVLVVYLDDPTIDYLVIVQHLPSGEYYSGSIRELPSEDYQPLCEELIQVFPTPITEIKYIWKF